MSSEPLRPIVSERQPERPIDPGVKIGHVHLKVADLDRLGADGLDSAI